ncbi:MAG: hypothetical protein C0502_08335 [Opitutus sp.]|nr:hypothetical protein [Opitutus sp.]
MGNLGPAAEAAYLYEYARVTGYAGNYEEAEKAFLDVLALILKSNGEADRFSAPTLSEYSRMLHDTDQHKKAVPIYEQAVVALDRFKVESTDPIGYAELLDEFADTLRKAGLWERASAITARSAELKAAHPNEPPHFQPMRYKTTKPD